MDKSGAGFLKCGSGWTKNSDPPGFGSEGLDLTAWRIRQTAGFTWAYNTRPFFQQYFPDFDLGTGTYNLIRPQLNFFDSLDTGVGLTQPDRVWNNTPAQVCSWNSNNLPYQECGYCVPQCWADRLACLLEVSSQTGEKNARSNSATRKKRVPTSEHYFLPAADIEFIALHKLVSFVH